MGGTQSVITSEVVATGGIIIAGIFLFANANKTDGVVVGGDSASSKAPKKKGKKKVTKGTTTPAVKSGDAEPKVEIHTPPPPPVITADIPEQPTKAKKRKAKATKAPADVVTSVQPTASTSDVTSPPEVDDGPWKKVGTKRNIVESVTTGTASTIDDDDEPQEPKQEPQEPQTLAEKLLPKPIPTAVDDMLPAKAGIARVIRVKPEEKPAAGFSWDDYADEQDEDDEDDGGWGVVKSRNSRSKGNGTSGEAQPSRSSNTLSESLTKKQRQNIAKRDIAKAAKADAEKERLALLAKHKRALERERIDALYKNQKGGNKAVGGGMKASVDDSGALVWE